MVRAGGGEGTTSHSLQHDGIVAIDRGDGGAERQSGRRHGRMAKEATAACGYGVNYTKARAAITVN